MAGSGVCFLVARRRTIEGDDPVRPSLLAFHRRPTCFMEGRKYQTPDPLFSLCRRTTTVFFCFSPPAPTDTNHRRRLPNLLENKAVRRCRRRRITAARARGTASATYPSIAPPIARPNSWTPDSAAALPRPSLGPRFLKTNLKHCSAISLTRAPAHSHGVRCSIHVPRKQTERVSGRHPPRHRPNSSPA